MEKLIVTGTGPLRGRVSIGGAKNAAVAILPATIMADGPCVLENVPGISDVSVLIEIMQSMGAGVRMLDPHRFEIDGRGILSPEHLH